MIELEMREQSEMGKMQRLVDGKLGIISELELLPNYHDLPQIYRVRAYRNPLIDRNGREISPAVSEGFGFKEELLPAKMAAVGEVIERYCSTFYKNHDMVVSSYRNITSEAISPERIARFSDSQYQREGFVFENVNEDTVIPWVRGKSLVDKRSIWVPADLVFLVQNEHSHPIRDYTSNGLACGSSYWQAVYASLCELIERDAFFLTWLLRLPAPRIKYTSLRGKSIHKLLKVYQEHGYRIVINELTTNLNVPTYLATAISETKWPRVAVAAKTSLNAEKAIKGALEELAGVISGLRDDRDRRPEFNPDYLGSHAFYYADGERTELLNFYLESEEIDLAVNEFGHLTGHEAVEMIRREFNKAQIDVAIVDLTTADIREAGLSVTRAIAPELQSLYIGQPYLQSRRLWDLAAKYGIRKVEDLNLEIHPFS
ncbi:YcaO-like family protein [Falsibacillus albus]|uniref:YcaO domain-containing protein n=1 Tax=Falsibacillus albus TaxID=2478915 RepID=A0A3L7JVE2_9BACI|nr:YcaO-like family protein [Falsibacillus albus]RLQ94838.1 hypothetical protein D9X91_12675 [Falsibacillus albus]